MAGVIGKEPRERERASKREPGHAATLVGWTSTLAMVGFMT